MFLVPLAEANCSDCFISRKRTEANLHIHLCYEAVACLAPGRAQSIEAAIVRRPLNALRWKQLISFALWLFPTSTLIAHLAGYSCNIASTLHGIMVLPDISIYTYLCRRDRISWAITIRFLLDSPSVFFLLRDTSRNEFHGHYKFTSYHQYEV